MLVSIDLGTSSSKVVLVDQENVVALNIPFLLPISGLDDEFNKLVNAINVTAVHLPTGVKQVNKFVLTTSWPSWIAINQDDNVIDYFRFDDARYISLKSSKHIGLTGSCSLPHRRRWLNQKGIIPNKLIPLNTYLAQKLTGGPYKIDKSTWFAGGGEISGMEIGCYVSPCSIVGKIAANSSIAKSFQQAEVVIGTGDTIAAKHASESLFNCSKHLEVGTTPILVGGKVKEYNVSVDSSFPNYFNQIFNEVIPFASQDFSFIDRILSKKFPNNLPNVDMTYVLPVDKANVIDLSKGHVVYDSKLSKLPAETAFLVCIKYLTAQLGDRLKDTQFSVGGTIGSSFVFRSCLSKYGLYCEGGSKYMSAIGAALIAGARPELFQKQSLLEDCAPKL